MATGSTQSKTTGSPHPSCTAYSHAVLRIKSQACRERLRECLKVVDQDDDWLEQKTAVFNWWSSGLNADTNGPDSLDNELSLRPDVRDVLSDVLDGLESALHSYYEKATSEPLASQRKFPGPIETDNKFHVLEDTERSPSPWSDMTDGSGNKSQFEESDKDVFLRHDVFREQRVLIETNLETLVRIHTSIKQSRLEFRNRLADEALKKADEDFQQQKVTQGEYEALLGPYGEHERFRRFLTKLTLWNSYSEDLIQTISLGIEKSIDAFDAWYQDSADFLLQKKLLVVLRAYLHDPARLSTIQRRLVNANLIRRNRLIYAKRALKVSSQKEKTYQARSMFQNTIRPSDTMNRTQLPRWESAAFSREMEGESKANKSYMTQKPPDMESSAGVRRESYPNCPARRGQFTCPYCCAILTDEYTQEEKWRGHVDQDLCAYVCVFEDCESPDDMFASMHEWMYHMAVIHSENEWVCPLCDKHSAVGIRHVSNLSFTKSALLEEHMHAYHAITDPLESKLLIDASERVIGIQRVACPLCKGNPISMGNGKDNAATYSQHKHDITLIQLDHIAAHLYEFASHAFPSSGEGFSSLGFGYGVLCQANRDIHDLMMVIDCFQKALDVTSLQHPDRSWICRTLGHAFRLKFSALGEPSDGRISLSLLQESLALVPKDHPARGATLYVLGSLYNEKYTRTADLESLDLAIKYFQVSIDSTKGDDPSRIERHGSLGAVFRVRYQRLSVMEDLVMAIEHLQDALGLTTTSRRDRARRLYNLALTLTDMYRISGSQRYLATVIRLSKEAVNITSNNDSNRASRLHLLGAGYFEKFKMTKATEDIDRTLQYMNEAIKWTGDQDQHPSGLFSFLGYVYRARYLHIGASEDLDMAIRHTQREIDVMSKDNHNRRKYSEILGLDLITRYGLTGAMTDLETGMGYIQDILNSTSDMDFLPQKKIERAEQLRILAWGHKYRYERTSAVLELDMAISTLEEALALTPSEHSLRPKVLELLGNLFFLRYRDAGESSDLETSIIHYQEALSLFPKDYPDRATTSKNLRRLYVYRSKDGRR